MKWRKIEELDHIDDVLLRCTTAYGDIRYLVGWRDTRGTWFGGASREFPEHWTPVAWFPINRAIRAIAAYKPKPKARNRKRSRTETAKGGWTLSDPKTMTDEELQSTLIRAAFYHAHAGDGADDRHFVAMQQEMARRLASRAGFDDHYAGHRGRRDTRIWNAVGCSRAASPTSLCFAVIVWRGVDTERQREQRQQSIGASEVAAMIGLDPRKSEMDLWAIKTGQVQESEPDQEQSERMLIGELMEEPVAKLLERRHSRKVVKPTGTYRHSSGVLQANIDRQFDKAARGHPVIEIKNTGYTEGWGEPELGNEALPIHVLVQVQAQLLCSDADKAVVAVMQARNGQRLVEYSVYRVDRICTLIAERVPAWWEKHVVKGERPELDRQPYDTLARIKSIAGKSIEIAPEIVVEYAQVRAEFDKAEAALDAVKERIARLMGDAEVGSCSAGKVHFKAQERETFDAARFCAENPKVAAEFTKIITTARSLRVYAKKGVA